MKKYLIIALIVLICIQIAVPIYMIADKYDTIRTGIEIKMRVRPYDPYDAFRGRYVSFSVDGVSSEKGKYGIITVDKDGFAKISHITNYKQKNDLYVKSTTSGWFSAPINRYYMDEKLAPKADVIAREFGGVLFAYVTVRIKNGKAVVTGLYVENTPIEDYIKNKE